MVAIIQNQINALSSTIGLDPASLKILLCTLLSFPFGIIFKRIPDQKYFFKNIYNVLVSSFYIFGICDLRWGLGTLLLSSLGSYFITRYLRTPKMPWINFLFLMIHMAYTHFHLQFFAEYDPSIIDISGAQMILVLKLSAFGWSIHDGKQPSDSLSNYNRTRAIHEHPNLLPFIGYVFFYASLLTGPAFDYVDYDHFIHSTLFDDVPEDKRPGKKRKRRIPRSGRQALKKLLQGLFWAFLLFEVPKLVNTEFVFSKEFVTKHHFIYRIFYMWLLGFLYRLKYYAIWLIAEGACILCGIGYNGYDAETKEFKWNRVQNVDPVTFELGQNVHTCLEAWNQNTNKWLKHYVYLRVAKKGRKPGFKSTVFTFATSAFWHGTRPGYYLTFVVGAFLQTIAKFYRRNIRPHFLQSDGVTPKPTKKIYDFVSWVSTQLAFGFVVQPFVILNFKKSLLCWQTVYYWLLFVIAGSFFIYRGPPAKYFTIKRPESKTKNRTTPTKSDTLNSNLSKEENDLIKNAVENNLEKNYHMPTLGVPSFDHLQSLDKDDIDEELQNLKQAWSSFKSRNFLADDDFDGLKDAYSNFTKEINEIFDRRKEEFSKQQEKSGKTD
ncbi:Ale1 protein [Candida orthopsilosis Co 90-125]|uniref:Ale1 protein n=1 Tax=Candida orthopsilosis (strain 90-125) TaxID=1136231 RepID=H8X387_CANO9|nr:Ale1 protein [Candida orthopsilosis Co 90-125]CCG25947.1 Ale1 protein [Candida orthopsilosis Co 90-125]